MSIEITIADDVIYAIQYLETISKGREWLAEFWGRKNENSFHINQLLLQKQEVSFSQVNQSISDEKQTQYRHETFFHYMRHGRIAGKTLLGWIHSHGTLGAFLSITDRKQVRRYRREINPVISIVVTSSFAHGSFSGLAYWLSQHSIRIRTWIDGEIGNTHHSFEEFDQVVYNPSCLFSQIPNLIKNQLDLDFNLLVTQIS